VGPDLHSRYIVLRKYNTANVVSFLVRGVFVLSRTRPKGNITLFYPNCCSALVRVVFRCRNLPSYIRHKRVMEGSWLIRDREILRYVCCVSGVCVHLAARCDLRFDQANKLQKYCAADGYLPRSKPVHSIYSINCATIFCCAADGINISY
jgi:hypothetical protein